MVVKWFMKNLLTCWGLWSKDKGITVPFASQRMPRESPTLATVNCPVAESKIATNAVLPFRDIAIVCKDVVRYYLHLLPATSLRFLASTSRALSDSMMAVVSSLDRSNSPFATSDWRFDMVGIRALLFRRSSSFLAASLPLLSRLNMLFTLGDESPWPTIVKHAWNQFYLKSDLGVLSLNRSIL